MSTRLRKADISTSFLAHTLQIWKEMSRPVDLLCNDMGQRGSECEIDGKLSLIRSTRRWTVAAAMPQPSILENASSFREGRDPNQSSLELKWLKKMRFYLQYLQHLILYIQVHIVMHRHLVQRFRIITQIYQLLDMIFREMRLNVSQVFAHDLRLGLFSSQPMA